MNDPAVKLHTSAAAEDLARDEQGRLYLKSLRQLFHPLNVDMAPVEALAALRVAWRTMHLLQERWGASKGLSEGRLGVLFRLYRSGDMPLGQLADELMTTPRNITGLVDHLERDGLVTRVADPVDRRSMRARLTETGRERIEGIWREGIARQYEIVKGMSKDDLAQLRHLCLLLVENARKELGK